MADQLQFSDVQAFQGLGMSGQYVVIAPLGLGQMWSLARMTPDPVFLSGFSDSATAMAAAQADYESILAAQSVDTPDDPQDDSS